MITAMTGKARFFYVWEMLSRLLIIFVLLLAALPKLFNIADFTEIISAYGILPDIAVQPVAVVLPIIEIGLAVALFLKIRTSKFLTILLFLFFIVILSYALIQGLDIDCGCFGPEDPEHRAFQGLRIAIVRDVVMIFLLLYSIWYEQYQKSNTNYFRS